MIDKRYIEQIVRRRVHQPVFRARVIVAYDRTCAICRLRHPELLDAAHIIADSQAAGAAIVTNGLALCKIHHAAYDNNLVGIDGDYRVHVNGALLHEVDGVLRRADHPSKDALDARFAVFSR